ncbi:hypothetical protein D9758_007158 [Tetrapyrgos nigripes]|uniref:Uncharacterized protein n=1 Tax=Tetrapyrgos nigripes TaxID=182062 RepID=A0A8H5GDQ0_9AGAR|nr:hypothetical protein D9758_007158 [Tetrapyrgos nigripes]
MTEAGGGDQSVGRVIIARVNSFLPTPSHLTTPPKLKPSGSKAASGSKANKPAAKKWSHAPFGRSDSKATSNEESLSDRESGGTSVLAKTTETISKPVKKAPAEQPKPKKSSITQRVVRKRLPPSPEVDEGLGDEEDQLDEMDYDIPLEPLGPVPEEPDVDASGEDGLRDGSEIPVPFTGSLRHGSEGQEEEVADSEQQDSPSDPEADVEAEVDAREDEGVRLDRTSFKAKDDIREVSPVVDMADDGPGDKAGKGRSPTPVASAAPTAVPAKSVPSRQPSDSGSSRSKPAPKATTNAVAGPSRVGPASENATESATLKIGPPKKVYSGSNGFPRDKPKRDLPKTITPITPPPRTNTDKSRPRTPKLSPNALKQLAEFDAFMAPLFPEPAPAVTLPAPVNGANVTDNHGHPPSPVSPSSPQNNLNARDNDTPPRPHSPSQARVKDTPTSDHDTNPYPNGVLEPEPLTSEHLQPSNPSPSSPKRRTIKSQMKPRSPGPLKHAPMKPMKPMTPNRMKAMYNSVGKSMFEQPDSTIQQFSDDGTEPSASQISQFESPEKQRQVATPLLQKGGGLLSLGLEMKGTKRSNPFNRLTTVTEVDMDVRQKGEALAEKHRKQILLERNGGEIQKKRVEDIQAERMNAPGKGKTVMFVEPTPTPTPEDVPAEPPEYEDGDQEWPSEVRTGSARGVRAMEWGLKTDWSDPSSSVTVCIAGGRRRGRTLR